MFSKGACTVYTWLGKWGILCCNSKLAWQMICIYTYSHIAAFILKPNFIIATLIYCYSGIYIVVVQKLLGQGFYGNR